MRSAICLAVLICASSAEALAQTAVQTAAQNAPATLGDAHCRVVDLAPRAGKTVSWTGACKDDYADGIGVLQWTYQGKETGRYEGALVRGRAEGPGRFVYANHAVFSGTYKNGRWDGEGVTTYANGSKLLAIYERGAIHGDVDYQMVDGDHYHGEWHNGINGKGVMTYLLGGSYEGQWLMGKANGRGAVIYPNGARREGEFRDGQLVAGAAASVVKAPTAAGSAAGPNAGADAAPEKFTMRQETAFTGSEIRRVNITGGAVPFELAYPALTPEQQVLVKAAYPILQDGDEPPYPLYGPAKLAQQLNKLASKLQAEGEFWMSVHIDADGKPDSVAMLKSPAPEMVQPAAAIMMLEKYKPALCAGKPCAMSYPLHMTFTRRR